jgi:hypothetical protein
VLIPAGMGHLWIWNREWSRLVLHGIGISGSGRDRDCSGLEPSGSGFRKFSGSGFGIGIEKCSGSRGRDPDPVGIPVAGSGFRDRDCSGLEPPGSGLKNARDPGIPRSGS